MPELHPEVRRILDEAVDRPDVTELGVEGARQQAVELAGDVGSPPVETVEERSISGPHGEIPVRVYRPTSGPLPVVVYFHGGGWVRGDLDTHDPLCRSIANAAGCAVVSVAYRRAPEHPFPAALEDADAAIRWLARNPDTIGGDGWRAVAGDSAGGNLAAAVALLANARGGPDLAGQILLYPVLDDDLERESYAAFAEGYRLSRDGMAWYLDRYLPGEIHRRNPYALPAKACDGDLDGLPPATVLTAGFDPLRDEAAEYAERLREAGVPVTYREFDDVVHGFMRWLDDPDLDRAHEAVEFVARELDAAFAE